MKTIKLTGPFTDADIAAFVALLRTIDGGNPTGVYAITITDPDMGQMDEAARFVSSLLPPLPDRATEFARASYRDDKCSPRACDHCGQIYRGPSVYCCFECAFTDS